MSGRKPLASFRLSQRLRDRVQGAGELSSAARALLILGLVAAGEPIDRYRDEAQQALAGVADPAIAAALGRLLYDPGMTPVQPGLDHTTEPVDSTPPEAAPAEELGDPFAVGFEV